MLQTEQQDKELTQWLTKQYQFVPHGLIFKLEEDRSFHDPGPLHLETRGLGDGTLKFEPDDVVNLKVFPAYKTMLVNRGRYFSFFNRPERAMEAFTSALALDPNLEAARQGLSESMEKLRNSKDSLPETAAARGSGIYIVSRYLLVSRSGNSFNHDHVGFGRAMSHLARFAIFVAVQPFLCSRHAFKL